MFFIKGAVTGREVELYEDDIYTYCPKCGKKLYPFKGLSAPGLHEFLDSFPEDYEFEFASTALICEDCAKNINEPKRKGEKAMSENTNNIQELEQDIINRIKNANYRELRIIGSFLDDLMQ